MQSNIQPNGTGTNGQQPSNNNGGVQPNGMAQGQQSQTSTAQTPVYFAGNPLNSSRAQWQQAQCAFSQVFKFLTGKNTEPCGHSERPLEACNNCQRIQPFFMRLEWTREIPAADVPSLGSLMSQTFPLPNGCRLLVFISEEEAKKSPWGNAPYKHGAQYVYVNQHGQQAVCFQVCKCCRRCELKPIAGVDPTLFCKKGDPNKIASVAIEHKKHALSSGERSSRGYGRPEPCRFVFNESTFPVNVKLPSDVLLRKKNPHEPATYLTADDIVCFFDDVSMPFRIENNVVIIDVQRNPFEKLYRPKEYDNLAITLAVYRKGGKVPTPGLNLAGPQNTQQQMDTDSKSGNGDIFYKSTFRFYMFSPELGNGASDSESDNDEQAIPKGVVAKRRYHMADHLQLAMTFKGQEAFYTVIQGYLRGGFFVGSDQDRATEKSKRNSVFTEVMKHDVAAARKYVANLLLEVGRYYIQNCGKEPDFREGLLQLLDFAHSLGQIGLIPFVQILKNSPFVSTNKPISFRFPRKFGNEIRNVIVTATPDGEISEIQENNATPENKQQAENASQSLSSNFDIESAFARLTITETGATALDAMAVDESKPVVKLYPATGFNTKKSESSDVKDDAEVNPHLGKLRREFKSLEEQVANLTNTLTGKIDKETAQVLLATMQKSGYMVPNDKAGVATSEVTTNFWQAGIAWACALWPHNIKESKDGIDGATFINIMKTWLSSKEYTQLGLDYSIGTRISHLQKLFILYSNSFASSNPLNLEQFVQCVLLFLMPNGLTPQKHPVLSMHASNSLYSAIDGIYDALTDAGTGNGIQLFQGAKSRPGAEEFWHAYKAQEQKDNANRESKVNVPFFLRLPEIRIEKDMAFALNLLQCFVKSGDEFTHMPLALSVINDNTSRTLLVDDRGQEHGCLGEWQFSYLTGNASTNTHNAGRSTYEPRRKRFKGQGPNTGE